MFEKELIDRVTKLEGELKLKNEKVHLLNLRCTKLEHHIKKKEDIEKRLEERYSQVEELQKERERSEDTHQKQLKVFIEEIKDRDEAFAYLEAANTNLLNQLEEMEKSKQLLQDKVDQLKTELKDRVLSETQLKNQCKDLEKSIKDWELILQQEREHFAVVENELHSNIIELEERLQEKGKSLIKNMRFLDSKKNVSYTIKSSYLNTVFPPEIPSEAKANKEVNRMTEAKKDKVSSTILLKNSFERELNEKSRQLDEMSHEFKTLNVETWALKEQLRQHYETEHNLKERNVLLEGLIEDAERKTKAFQEKITHLEELLTMKKDTEHQLQARVDKQDYLLKEMEIAQKQLSQCNEELDTKQQEVNEELQTWKVKCFKSEQNENEMRSEIKQLKEVINKLEAEKSDLETCIQLKNNELEELCILKTETITCLTSEINRLTKELENKDSLLQKEKYISEIRLNKASPKPEATEETINVMKEFEDKLKEREREIKCTEAALLQEKKLLENQLSEKTLLIKNLEGALKEEKQLSSSMGEELQLQYATLRRLQELEIMLRNKIEDLKKASENISSLFSISL
nr:PREDICTED: putative leucine-rich repeat-containing protein DDB_G0290503 [Latimeria chalumnae]|eukprot:XP_005999906.2 PREDICTED: putative leucine-rich repeat-containing protein DDB_G0290503 [Latimeria chalumnae]